ATVFEGFVVRGADNAKPTGNWYGVYVSGSSASLVIRSNQVFAGRGGPGTTGAAGSNGALGTNGAAYSAGLYDSYQATGAGSCAASNNRGAYGAGVHACGANNVN